eukprot:scaffold2691_cov417-Prasinococcus_capsulatus_cf.AAC.26
MVCAHGAVDPQDRGSLASQAAFELRLEEATDLRHTAFVPRERTNATDSSYRTIFLRGGVVGKDSAKAALTIYADGHIEGRVLGLRSYNDNIWLENDSDTGAVIVYGSEDVEVPEGMVFEDEEDSESVDLDGHNHQNPNHPSLATAIEKEQAKLRQESTGTRKLLQNNPVGEEDCVYHIALIAFEADFSFYTKQYVRVHSACPYPIGPRLLAFLTCQVPEMCFAPSMQSIQRDKCPRQNHVYDEYRQRSI